MRFGPRVRWDLTWVCNLACRHCQIGNEKQINAMHPPRDHVMSLARNMNEGGVSHVGLLGGEPLLHPNILELLQFFSDNGIQITINSNGISLPQGILPILTESYGWSIMISLDGPDAETHAKIRGPGTFERTIKNIESLVSGARDHQIVVGIACTLTSHTVWRMKEFYDLAVRLGVNILQFGVVKNVGNARMNYRELEVEPISLITALIQFVSQFTDFQKSCSPQISFDFLNGPVADLIQYQQGGKNIQVTQTGCVGAELNAYLDPAGNLWPCPAVRESFETGILQYSGIMDNSLIKNSFRTSWYGKLFQQFRGLKKEKEVLIGESPCNRCRYSCICMPCPLYLWVSSPLNKNDLCECALSLLSTSKLRNAGLGPRTGRKPGESAARVITRR